MTPAQRRVCFRALLAGAAAGAVLFGIVFANTRAITAPRYRLTISIVARARTPMGAVRAGSGTVDFVSGVLQAHGLEARRSIDSRPAVGNDGNLDGRYIHEVALTVTSRNEALLESMSSAIESGSGRRVIDLASAGEFVPARNGSGVQLWRLRSSGAAQGPGSGAWIQINGPAATMAYSDYFMFAFIFVLMLSFGSLERNNNDPRAFPAGMHPAVIVCQALLLSLLVCWLWICYSGGYTGALFLTIASVGAASLFWWAFKTRRYWTGTIPELPR